MLLSAHTSVWIVLSQAVEFSHITIVGRDVTFREILFIFRCFFNTLHGTVAFGSGVMERPLQLFARLIFIPTAPALYLNVPIDL